MKTFLEKFTRYVALFPDTGGELAAKGIAKALENERLEWRESVLTFAEKYAKANEFFRMENIHYLWTMQGGADPHSDKVWGGISQAIVKRGYCEFYAYVKAINVKSHGSIIIAYKSKIYEPLKATELKDQHYKLDSKSVKLREVLDALPSNTVDVSNNAQNFLVNANWSWNNENN